MSLSYSKGDCIKFTTPNAEGIPMLITDKGDGWYDIFYIYPGIGKIHFRALEKRIHRDTKRIDKKACKRYNVK